MSLVQRGGVRIGKSFWRGLSATWPFATLDVDRRGITLAVLGTEHHLPRAQVRGVKLVGPAWMPLGLHGVRFVHGAPKVPPYVLFWSLNRRALVRALHDEGYVVTGNTDQA